MGYCTECGERIAAGTRFCGTCGTQLGAAAEAPEANPHPQADPAPGWATRLVGKLPRPLVGGLASVEDGIQAYERHR